MLEQVKMNRAAGSCPLWGWRGTNDSRPCRSWDEGWSLFQVQREAKKEL